MEKLKISTGNSEHSVGFVYGHCLHYVEKNTHLVRFVPYFIEAVLENLNYQTLGGPTGKTDALGPSIK